MDIFERKITDNFISVICDALKEQPYFLQRNGIKLHFSLEKVIIDDDNSYYENDEPLTIGLFNVKITIAEEDIEEFNKKLQDKGFRVYPLESCFGYSYPRN